VWTSSGYTDRSFEEAEERLETLRGTRRYLLYSTRLVEYTPVARTLTQ